VGLGTRMGCTGGLPRFMPALSWHVTVKVAPTTLPALMLPDVGELSVMKSNLCTSHF
jgi:hypothetical protein